ncbi:hypothetical protein GALMADRAFT_414161 [Galerina marginata CBS 339.88]|uniref:Uncharacterized protein n=1 Tax=Galerina marginata (strain CBS 339.88) TaxID=685588 RepID=A0A067T637_GALM3|nr:hypothetical protein GALMADRAFT_414161 [Galerina marginata CBS 339.88]
MLLGYSSGLIIYKLDRSPSAYVVSGSAQDEQVFSTFHMHIRTKSCHVLTLDPGRALDDMLPPLTECIHDNEAS